MEIKHEEQNGNGRFYRSDELGEINYSREDDRITVHHTSVDESLKGKGVGNQLVEAIVAFAREEQLRVYPLCPFAKAVMTRKKAYHDVLDADKI